MRSNPLAAIVVGAGLMGRWHADAIRRCGAKVAAIVDVDLDEARRLSTRYRGCLATDDLAAALAVPDVAVAHLCTPSDARVGPARTILQGGVHLLAEKPLAPDAALTRELVSLARERDLVLCPVHQFLFQRGFTDALDQLPRLGGIRHVDTVACSAGADGRSDDDTGRILADLLPHPLSLFRRILDRPIGDVDWLVLRPGPGELRATSAPGGVTLDVLVSFAGRPTRNTLRIIGADGTLHVDLFHGFAVPERSGVSRRSKLARPFALSAATLMSSASNLARRIVRWEPAYPGLRELVRRFHLAAGGAGAPPISADEIVDVARARDALIRGFIAAESP